MRKKRHVVALLAPSKVVGMDQDLVQKTAKGRTMFPNIVQRSDTAKGLVPAVLYGLNWRQ